MPKDKKHKKIVTKKKVKVNIPKTRKNKKQLNNSVPSFVPAFEVPSYSYQNRGAMNPPIMPSMEQLFMNAINSGLNYQQPQQTPTPQPQPPAIPKTKLNSIPEQPLPPKMKPPPQPPKEKSPPISTTGKTKIKLSSITSSTLQKPPFKEIIKETQQTTPQPQNVHGISKEKIKKAETRIRKIFTDQQEKEPVRKKHIDPAEFGQTDVYNDIIRPAALSVITPFLATTMASARAGVPLRDALTHGTMAGLSSGVTHGLTGVLGTDPISQEFIAGLTGFAVGAAAPRIQNAFLNTHNRVVSAFNHVTDRRIRHPEPIVRDAPEVSRISGRQRANSESSVVISNGQSPATLRHRNVNNNGQGEGLGISTDPLRNADGSVYRPVFRDPNANRRVGQRLTTLQNPAELNRLEDVNRAIRNLQQMENGNHRLRNPRTEAELVEIRQYINEGIIRRNQLMREQNV